MNSTTGEHDVVGHAEKLSANQTVMKTVGGVQVHVYSNCITPAPTVC